MSTNKMFAKNTNRIDVYSVNFKSTRLRTKISMLALGAAPGKVKDFLLAKAKGEVSSNTKTLVSEFSKEEIKALVEAIAWEYEEAMFTQNAPAMSLLKTLFKKVRPFDYSHNMYQMDTYALYGN